MEEDKLNEQTIDSDKSSKSNISKKSTKTKRKKRKYKRKRGRKKMPWRKKFKENRESIVNKIFDSSTKDMSYVTSNPALLEAHKKFILDSNYSFNNVDNFIEEDLEQMPKIFDFFRQRYAYIWKRWYSLLNICYNKNHVLYPMFGAKGVKLSNEFLDAKFFCIWCLENGLTGKYGSYTTYLQRKDKTKSYSPSNCYVVTEKDNHNGKSLKSVLESLRLIRVFEEDTTKSVSYLTFYTRYFVYDFDEYDALHAKLITTKYKYDFKPFVFYNSVATEKSCSFSTFASRILAAKLVASGNFIVKPYDMLKPEYSVEEECAKQGAISYKSQWERKRKEKIEKYNPYIKKEEPIKSSIGQEQDVYSYNKDLDVYSK